MNTTQLECFLSVANFLNFSRAAEQLRITQPAVSHQISTLEDELEVKLFQRSSKSVRLTQAGLIFFSVCQRDSQAVISVQSPAEGVPGADDSAAWDRMPEFYGAAVLRPVLARMRGELPQIDPVVRLIPFASLENLLEEEDVQVISCFKDSAPRKAVYQELLQCPLYVSVPRITLWPESLSSLWAR